MTVAIMSADFSTELPMKERDTLNSIAAHIAEIVTVAEEKFWV